MEKIKIFAAFGKDVEEDITRFGDFLCALNAQCKGIEFSMFKSERELCESLEQSKEKIDSELDICEYFLLILGGKNDEYPFEKLNQAIANYAKTHGNPDIHIFINNSIKGADANIGLFASDEYEHYVEQFNHNDTLKTKFLVWLSAKQKNLTYEVDNDSRGCPVIKINGRPVSGLVDFDAFLNNEDYQDEKKKLTRNKSKREKYIEELRDAEEDEKNDLWDDISALTKEIEEQQDKIASMEKDTLSLYQNYAKKTLESGYNSKLKRALDCIERGELERARRVLDPEGSINNLKAIENENEILAARIETNKNIAQQEINILFAEIDRLKLDTQNKNRFDEIEKCYANIEQFQEKLGLEVTVLFDYAYFLSIQNKHNMAVEKYIKELDRCRKLAQTSPDEYLPKVAKTLNNLASKLDLYHFNESRAYLYEALGIYRKFAEENPDLYLPDVIMILNNLAVLPNTSENIRDNIDEAANCITESLEISRKHVNNNPEIYLPYIASSLCILANKQSFLQCYEEAEENYIEALNIERKLSELNPDAYLHNIADILCNLASMQFETGRCEESETNFKEAMEIYTEFAEINPDAYYQDVAGVLGRMAELNKNSCRYDEAAINFKEALRIYRKLSQVNPDVYLPKAAITLTMYADNQNASNHDDEIDSIYMEIISIYRKLAETNPDDYLIQVSRRLESIANRQFRMERFIEAENNFTEAFNISCKLVEINNAFLYDLENIVSSLCRLYKSLNRHEEIKKLEKEFSEIQDKYESKSIDLGELDINFDKNEEDDEFI